MPLPIHISLSDVEDANDLNFPFQERLIFCFHHWVGAVIAAEIWSLRDSLIQMFVGRRFEGNSPLGYSSTLSISISIIWSLPRL
jgi:hypothetical protein